jgi:transposase
MIPFSADVKIWIATGHTDMRSGMNSLARLVEQHLGRNFHDGDLYVFRGRRGNLVKILWSDALGVSLYSKRLERGHFIWPSAKDGAIALTPSALACLLEGIDWRNPQRSWRPSQVG